MVEVGGGWWRWLPGEGPVKLPRKESGTALAVVESLPIVGGESSVPREPQCVPYLGK